MTPAVPFTFESYGVIIRMSSNLQDLLDDAQRTARNSLLGNVRPVDNADPDLQIELTRIGRQYFIYQNGDELASGTSRRKLLKFFDSVIRASVGEHAPERVFLHGGVVGWNGKAIVLPADSYKGKSTIVAELVRCGAAYLSDDFTIFDDHGMVHAFPRPLSMRTEDHRLYRLTARSLGSAASAEPLPVGLVLFTEYKADAEWDPQVMSPGNGVLGMIPYTLTFRLRPESSLAVLNKVAARAIIASSPRGNATEFAPVILNFVDKNAN